MASPSPALVLVACPDDYLLERAVARAVRDAEAERAVEPEYLSDDVTPEDVAYELGARSLFTAQRILVAGDVSAWFGGRRSKAEDLTVPLVSRLRDVALDDTVLILGACLSRQPAGPLAEAVAAVGDVRWLPLPPPPKPWEDTVLSREQRTLLQQLLEAETPELRLSRGAARLLLDRLGFAPRLLVQEARTLAAAVSAGDEVDEALVRRLSFPPERSLDAVRGAVLERQPADILSLLAAADGGLPVRDWRGQRMAAAGVPAVVVGQVSSLLLQLLYVRRVSAELTLTDALDPRAIAARSWYPRTFKPQLAPRLRQAIQSDAASVFQKVPSEWALSQLFAGAARYTDHELLERISEAGDVEAATRGAGGHQRLLVWCARLQPTAAST